MLKTKALLCDDPCKLTLALDEDDLDPQLPKNGMHLAGSVASGPNFGLRVQSLGLLAAVVEGFR